MIAVASGKGGVGKSSLTANLAAALSLQGHQVGILDADIYGHSIPHMLGIQQKPVLVDKLMIPPVNHDLKLMSIGFFVDDNAPLMWRGPMLHRALEQFLQDVHWGDLDVLVVDMPPGTGDVSISLGQMLPRAEAVVVTTPQALAQEVASRAAEMARKTGMQLLGVIENMTSEVFGSGGGERLAAQSACRCSARCRSTRGSASRRRRRAARPLGSRVGAGAGDRRDRRRLDKARGGRLHPHAAACLLRGPRAPRRRSGSRPRMSARSPSLRGRRGARPCRARVPPDRVARDVGAAPDSTRARSASRLGAGLRALGRGRRARLPRPRRDRRGAARGPARACAGSSSPATRSRPGCSGTGRAASPTAGSSRR